MKKNLLIILLLSLSLAINAQWNQLPNAIGPYSAPYPPCYMSLTIPYFVMPVGDGKIWYTSDCQVSPSSGGTMYMQYSTNDMFSMTIKGTFGGMYCCALNNASSANDTSFSFIYGSFGYGMGEFTSNNFASSVTVGSIIGSAGNGAGTSITTNYIYSIFRNPSDTMLVFRRNKAVSSVTTKQSHTYIYNVVSDKLQFINDSTGFTIAAFKSNLSKMTLLKTTDYGVTWQPTLIDSIDPIVDHHALSANRMYLCKKSGAVYTSTNAGLSWTIQSSAPGGNYTAIRFRSDTVGYIGGAGGALYKSTNYGTTWTAETSNTTNQINRIFTFGNVAYFVDATLKVFKNGPLNYTLFSPLNSSPVQTAGISCATKYATSSYTVGSLYGPPYKFSIQSPSCTTSYTTSGVATNPTFTFNCPGIYSITATDGNNVPLGTQTLSVLMSSNYTTIISATMDTTCIGSPVQLTFPTNGPSYTIGSFAWSTGENYVPITVTPTATSTYSLSYGQMTNGSYTCNVQGSKNIIVTPCAAGIKEAEKTGQFRVYPNPATSSLYISSPPPELKNLMIEISNAIGQVIIKSPFKSEIDIRQLTNGYYILKIYFGDSVLHYNFIKE